MPPGSSSHPATTAFAWIHVPTLDRVTLERVHTEIGFPSELITYCLLAQRSPKIIPCGAWLHSAWQVPLITGDAVCGAVAFRLEEIKACVGPQAFVTVYRTRSKRVAAQLDGFLPTRDTAAQSGSGRLLVVLAERIAGAYLSLCKELADESLEVPGSSATRARYARLGARVRLGRHLADHAKAVEQIRTRGARWLDVLAQKHLENLASHLADLGAPTASETTDPEAS